SPTIAALLGRQLGDGRPFRPLVLNGLGVRTALARARIAPMDWRLWNCFGEGTALARAYCSFFCSGEDARAWRTALARARIAPETAYRPANPSYRRRGDQLCGLNELAFSIRGASFRPVN